MKKLIIPILLVISLNAFGQNRIGKQLNIVRAEYKDPKYNLKLMKVDSASYLIIQDKYASIIHRFGSDSLCNKTYVTLPDTLIAREVASTYDIIYEPKSTQEWIVRQPDQVLDVELVTTTNTAGIKQPTFQWTRVKEDRLKN